MEPFWWKWDKIWSNVKLDCFMHPLCNRQDQRLIFRKIFFSHISGIIWGMGSAHERPLYNVAWSLIGWAHTQNDPYNLMIIFNGNRSLLCCDGIMHQMFTKFCTCHYKTNIMPCEFFWKQSLCWNLNQSTATFPLNLNWEGGILNELASRQNVLCCTYLFFW